jgi:type I restriction enzyme R subunit
MAYIEDALIEQPAIKLFEELGWEVLNGWEESFGADSNLGRENRCDIVLTNRLRTALLKLNAAANKTAIDEAIDDLTRDCSAMSAIAANQQLYLLLKEGKLITN